MSKLRRHIMMQQGCGVLPTEYQQVEYLESTGTQWIDSGVYANQSRTKIIIDCALPSFTSNKYCEFTGVYTASSYSNYRRAFALGYESGKIVAQFISWQKTNLNAPNDKATFILEKNKLKYNNTVIADQSNYIYNEYSLSTIYLFGKSSSDFNPPRFEHEGIFIMRIYHEQIFDLDLIVRDFYPCYRKSDNEPGMYDIVNDVFYTNAGSGTFIVGPDIMGGL